MQYNLCMPGLIQLLKQYVFRDLQDDKGEKELVTFSLDLKRHGKYSVQVLKFKKENCGAGEIRTLVQTR